MDKMEKITCSAIWYKEQSIPMETPKNISEGTVIYGIRHNDCINMFKILTGLETAKTICGEYTQGFITNQDRFVDRKEAMTIAIAANQFINKPKSKLRLHSEDLW